ncbi:MAG: polyprenol monophosphomannose synthase [Planctomycetaceae bacterium]|nr:MAG: polyprenol monophosphomannose synthase [Planctomycetaceae bacterium]
MTVDRVLVTLCTYNERDNLIALLPEIWRFVPTADILVVDDNSPDGTGQLVEDWSRRDARVRVLRRPGKLGLGTAILAALQYAVERDYDWVLNLDADFSHPPRFIPALLACRDHADLVIGSRYVPQGDIVGWPVRRHLMSRAINFYARWLLWLSTRDCSGGYRCYRVSTLRKLDLSKLRSHGYAVQEELLFHLNRAGARFAETPITFEERRYGASKINLGEGLQAAWIILRLGVWGA